MNSLTITLAKKQVKREHKPWITEKIKNNNNVRDEFFKKVNPVIRNNLYHQYKACRNQFVAAIRQRKKLKFVNFFNNNTRNSKKNSGNQINEFKK